MGENSCFTSSPALDLIKFLSICPVWWMVSGIMVLLICVPLVNNEEV